MPIRLIVANHVTFLDVVILLASYPMAFTLVKKSMAQYPLFRILVKNSGFISIDPENSQSRLTAFGKITDALNQHQTGVFFPEGTRSINGQLGEFNKGAFKALMMTKLDLTPVLITVSEPFLNRQSIFKNSGNKIFYKLMIFDNIVTPRPEVAAPRHLRAFKDEVWNFFYSRLTPQFCFDWQWMSRDFVYDKTVFKCLEVTENSVVYQGQIGSEFMHFKGHFPNYPILPAVSQLDIVCKLTSYFAKKDLRIRQVRRAKFTAPIHPNCLLKISILRNAQFWTWSICNGAQEVSQGVIVYD